MDATAAAPAATSLPEFGDHREDLREKHAHAGVAMAIAAVAMGLTSGIQALLYLNSFGIGGRTDGFFLTFALYFASGVFSQTLRVPSAPLLVGDRPRLTPREPSIALVAIAVPVAVATIALAG